MGKHGNAKRALDSDLGAAKAVLSAAAAEGVNLKRITRALEHEGVKAFCDSYRQLVDCIEAKVSRAALVR